MNVIKNCLNGIYTLLQDPAGVLCLLSLAIVSFLCYKGHVGDVAFAATTSLLSTLAVIMKHKSFSGSDLDNPVSTIVQQGMSSNVNPTNP